MKRTVDLLDQNGTIVPTILEIEVGVRTTLSISNGIVVQGDDVFDALQLLRRELANNGWQLLCQGSRQDVYPSRALRQSGTTKAYKSTLGRACTRADLVDLFDPCTKEVVSTVEEQDEFNRRWLSSLGEN